MLFNDINTLEISFRNTLDNEEYFNSEEKFAIELMMDHWYKGNKNELTDVVKNFDLNSNSQMTNIIRKIYYFQQKYFKDRNIKSLELYRGIGLKEEIEHYNGNKFESWTSDKDMAECFARKNWLNDYKKSGILIKNINIKDILFSQMIYKTKDYDGDEYICKSGDFNINESNFQIYKHRRHYYNIKNKLKGDK